MWVADSFSGLPPPHDYINAFARHRGDASFGFATDLHRMHSSDRKARIWSGGEFAASDAHVARNFRKVLPESLTSQGRLSGGGLPRGVHFLKGFFNESLPGPVTTLALLRADGDLYTSIYETLAALYSRAFPAYRHDDQAMHCVPSRVTASPTDTAFPGISATAVSFTAHG